MLKGNYMFTSESVTEGHPDKVCDQISDAVLDEILKEDPLGRVACETMVTNGLVVIGGEITTETYVDVEGVARKVISDIGYNSSVYGFDSKSCAVISSIHKQSKNIARGVNTGGAGDQGMMFGYACDETPELMPLPIYLAHKLAQRLAEVRKTKVLDYLGPDGKSQVSVEYKDSRPVGVTDIVLSTQHTEKILDKTGEKITRESKDELIETVIKPVLGDWIKGGVKFHINPTGTFLIGGPQADTGLTGRKIVVDTYGGMAPHGGGAFSGKDPTKVDRSAAYMARYIAKNIVAAGLARNCLVQIAYAIGIAEPVSFLVNTYSTGRAADERLTKIARALFPLKPVDIISALNLRKPVYLRTAAYGHFGRDGFAWENTDKAEALKKEALN